MDECTFKVPKVKSQTVLLAEAEAASKAAAAVKAEAAAAAKAEAAAAKAAVALAQAEQDATADKATGSEIDENTSMVKYLFFCLLICFLYIC